MVFDFIVLGAGASGLFFAARRERGGVLLLDHQARAGRKLLLSGGGKCNVTNRIMGPEHYICPRPAFVGKALCRFAPDDMLKFLEAHSFALEERGHGQIFLRRGADELRDLLLSLALENGAKMLMGGKIGAVRRLPAAGSEAAKSARFCVEYNGGEYYGRNLLVATGGPAWPRSGATGAGYGFARALGHSLIPAAPALTPLQMPPDWPLKGLQGLNPTVRVSLPGVKKSPSFTLPLMFTHGGLSGPACLQISSYLPDSPSGAVQMDFLPEHDLLELLDRPGGLTVAGLLRRHMPERLAAALLSGPELEPLSRARCAELGRARRLALRAAVQEFAVVPQKPGFERAEAARGGVDVNDVNPADMQSRLCPGLYFCGEVLDVTGQLGGYNLHWAWASAFTAALAAAHCA